MILLRAKTSNDPFYSCGETMSKEEWLKKLNLSEEKFEVINIDFEEFNTEITSVISGSYGFVSTLRIIVGRTDGLGDEEAEELKSEIDEILKKYNAKEVKS